MKITRTLTLFIAGLTCVGVAACGSDPGDDPAAVDVGSAEEALADSPINTESFLTTVPDSAVPLATRNRMLASPKIRAHRFVRLNVPLSQLASMTGTKFTVAPIPGTSFSIKQSGFISASRTSFTWSGVGGGGQFSLTYKDGVAVGGARLSDRSYTIRRASDDIYLITELPAIGRANVRVVAGSECAQ